MKYTKRVRLEPCLICGGAQGGSDPHHLRFMGGRGTALRAHDKWAVPLCRIHHNENHTYGNEIDFWLKHSVDPVVWAREFWEEHGDNT